MVALTKSNRAIGASKPRHAMETRAIFKNATLYGHCNRRRSLGNTFVCKLCGQIAHSVRVLCGRKFPQVEVDHSAYPMSDNHNHSECSTLCAACLESATYKEDQQAKMRSYSHAYYNINKDRILLKKALERIERGIRVNRRTIERLHEANIYPYVLAS